MCEYNNDTKLHRHSRMYYIWCDESDNEGAYYSNFYGGILVRSLDLYRVQKRLQDKVRELHIEKEEIKWQKVNKHMFEPYKELDSRKRGVRTIMKEKLYKHINFRIRQLRRGFNVGMSTGFDKPFEIWDQSYRHWSFIPKEHDVDVTRTKHYVKVDKK